MILTRSLPLTLVDTSVWVDFLNTARSPAADELARLIGANAALVLTGIVITEVLHGLKRDVETISGLLGRWPLIEPVGFVTYEAAASISRQARSRGVMATTVDALLAAVALEHDAELFTLDLDFQRLKFTGLRLHDLESR